MNPPPKSQSLDPPTMDEFFPLNKAETAETDADICRDITLLSALLNGYRSGKSTVLDAKHSDSKLWSHISYVLVPDTSQDLYGDNVVAVVRRIEPEFIAATVIAGNTSYSDTKHENLNPIEVDDVAMHQANVVDDMLNNPTTLPDDVSFDVHLRDVMSILSFLLDPDRRNKRPSESDMVIHIFDFIVMRCYRKLFARLESGTALWTKHPLEHLRDYYNPPQADGQASSTASSQMPVAPDQAGAAQVAADHNALSVKMPRAYMYESLLDAHGIRYTKNQSDNYFYATFSSSAAPAWARLLYTSYTTMSATLSVTVSVEDDTKTKTEARRPISRVECRKLQVALALLDDAIRGGVVTHLLQDKLMVDLNKRYFESMRQKTNPRLAKAINKARTGKRADIEYQYDADDLHVDAEDSRRHILRHLGALTTPLRAAITIVLSCFNAPITSLQAYQVVVPPNREAVITPEYFNTFTTQFAERLGGVDAEVVKNTLESIEPVITNVDASVHAEAALMSLVSANHDVEVNGTPTPIAALLPAEPIPVAVSKRCCFCCSRLAELLISGSDYAAESRFVFSGTHGAIFPWSPPHGLPRKVLQTMREELLDIFYDAFISGGVRLHSTQTSPAQFLIQPTKAEKELWALGPENVVVPPVHFTRHS
ncbi:hypothetical protein C8Q74DRAFT_1445230 [Fomes fomentarius]|nr:hypothetical protein C8Q74DRAFT_1445230 [Fomes fomentarius]